MGKQRWNISKSIKANLYKPKSHNWRLAVVIHTLEHNVPTNQTVQYKLYIAQKKHNMGELSIALRKLSTPETHKISRMALSWQTTDRGNSWWKTSNRPRAMLPKLYKTRVYTINCLRTMGAIQLRKQKWCSLTARLDTSSVVWKERVSDWIELSKSSLRLCYLGVLLPSPLAKPGT